MGARMTLPQQEDLGVLALASLRWAMAKKMDAQGLTPICSAVAHLVPLLAESDIRMLMYEVDSQLHNDDRHEWVELMTILRRIDRP